MLRPTPPPSLTVAGAIPWLWPRLRCPVFATPLTAAMIRRKLEEASLHHQVPVNVVQPNASVKVANALRRDRVSSAADRAV